MSPKFTPRPEAMRGNESPDLRGSCLLSPETWLIWVILAKNRVERQIDTSQSSGSSGPWSHCLGGSSSSWRWPSWRGPSLTALSWARSARAGIRLDGFADPPKASEAGKKGDEKKKGLPLTPDRTIEFTTDEGTWVSLDVSPDGKTIVFELLGDLYTVPIDGGEAKAIASGLAFDGQPRVLARREVDRLRERPRRAPRTSGSAAPTVPTRGR